jgi:hypothetical protein
VKRSAPYRLVRDRLVARCPSDVWREGGITFVVFQLTHSGSSEPTALAAKASAIFALRSGSRELLAARVLAMDGGVPEVTDLISHLGALSRRQGSDEALHTVGSQEDTT